MIIRRTYVFAWGVAACLGLSTRLPAQSLPARALAAPTPTASAPAAGWLKLEGCPVLVEHSVDIPALESGALRSIDVELNQTVAEGARVARLDNELAKTELRQAQLQYDAATRVAADDSDVQFRQLALQEVEEELANYRSISSSVSDSEIRKLNLSVGMAKLELIGAQQTQTRARLQAQLKAAALDTAKLRLARREVSTPLAGVVSAILLQPGQWVEVGRPILRVRNLEHLIVDRPVPIKQIDLTSIVGAEVRVEVRQQTGRVERLAGVVSSYDHEVSAQGYVRLHTRIKNVQRRGHWLLLPGMNVDLYVATHSASTSSAPKLTK